MQVGAFRTLEVAQGQTKLWSRRGYTTYLEPFSSKQTGDWLRIMVGVYLSKSEARQVAHHMQKKTLDPKLFPQIPQIELCGRTSDRSGHILNPSHLP